MLEHNAKQQAHTGTKWWQLAKEKRSPPRDEKVNPAGQGTDTCKSKTKKQKKKELSRMLSQTRRAKVDGRRWPQHGHKRYPGAKSSICVQTKTMAPDASRQEQEPTLGKRTSADTACKTE